MMELNHAKPEPLVKFLPLILNKLIQLMVKPPSVLGQVMNTGQTVFEAIAMLVRNVTVSAALMVVTGYYYRILCFVDCASRYNRCK